jgi:heme-degrading monooxygenase HmoA
MADVGLDDLGARCLWLAGIGISRNFACILDRHGGTGTNNFANLPAEWDLMLAVIFEVWPKDEGRDDYFATAADLKPLLQDVDGFISVERFQSLMDPKKVLSVPFWRDEEALMAWRKIAEHRIAQADGRDRLFKDYRLRVASVVRDYGMTDRREAPADSRAHHDRVQPFAAITLGDET